MVAIKHEKNFRAFLHKTLKSLISLRSIAVKFYLYLLSYLYKSTACQMKK